MKGFIFILIFCLCGCAHKQVKILPTNDTIIKLKVDENTGIIAESEQYSYQFTHPDALKKLKNYRDFLAEYKNDVESVSIIFYQDNLDGEITAQYINFIPENKRLSDKKLLEKYKSNVILKNGYYQVLFTTQGNVYRQANTLSDQYLLPKSITVLVRANHEIDSDLDIKGDVAGLIIFPIFVPLIMVGCLIGPC